MNNQKLKYYFYFYVLFLFSILIFLKDEVFTHSNSIFKIMMLSWFFNLPQFVFLLGIPICTTTISFLFLILILLLFHLKHHKLEVVAQLVQFLHYLFLVIIFIFLFKSSNDILDILETSANNSSDRPSITDEWKLGLWFLNCLDFFIFSVSIINNCNQNVKDKNNNHEYTDHKQTRDSCPCLDHLSTLNTIVIGISSKEVSIWINHNHQIKPQTICELCIWMDIHWVVIVLNHLGTINPKWNSKSKKCCSHDCCENSKLNVEYKENSIEAWMEIVKHLHILSNFDEKYEDEHCFKLSYIKNTCLILPFLEVSTYLVWHNNNIHNEVC